MKNSQIKSERKSFLQFLDGCKYIELTGAGGKTTTVFYLASEYEKQNKKVLVTTTTKMMKPAHMVCSLEEAEEYWKQGDFAAAGDWNPQNGKIGFPNEILFEKLSDKADIVLLEADGSKRMPAKAPRYGEPVILPGTDAVVCVMGMSAIGRKFSEVCFGLEEACEILNTTDVNQNFTTEMAARILSSPDGGRKNTKGKKFCVLLNQCDTAEREDAAEEIRRMLKTQDIPVFLQAYSKEEQYLFSKIANDNNDL